MTFIPDGRDGSASETITNLCYQLSKVKLAGAAVFFASSLPGNCCRMRRHLATRVIRYISWRTDMVIRYIHDLDDRGRKQTNS